MNMKTKLIAVCAFAALLANTAHAVSLYDEARYRPLAADNKAYRLGDTLTIQIIEASSATTSTDTGTRRKHGINGEVSNSGARTGQVGLSASGEFEGGGRTQRANRLLATVTVTVQEILENGDLRVSGEQSLTVNDELQKVTLHGKVRPADVSDANVVLSTRLADARITYVGEGDLAERGQRPWWRKLLDGMGF
jgi:flagellar L-ring protein FlgH